MAWARTAAVAAASFDSSRAATANSKITVTFQPRDAAGNKLTAADVNGGPAYMVQGIKSTTAVGPSDFAPVQGFVLTMAVMYVMLNLGIDILYGFIDPRMRLES